MKMIVAQAPLNHFMPLLSFFTTSLFQSTTQHLIVILDPLSANFTKWSNTLKQFVGKLPLFGKLP